MMNKKPDWCRECPFYYKGMTEQDYLYLQYLMRNMKYNIILEIQRGEVKLPPMENRTKEDVFAAFNGDIDYKFDVNTMC